MTLSKIPDFYLEEFSKTKELGSKLSNIINPVLLAKWFE